jgi:hypothetical protein
MILLNNIIHRLALPETRTAPEFAVSLHLRDRPWIGGVLVDRIFNPVLQAEKFDPDGAYVRK